VIAVRLGFLSTYPPTQCGLATFTKALASAVDTLPRMATTVVRSVEHPERLEVAGVAGELVAGDRLSQRRAAEVLNSCDVAVIQHEFGIYGGPWGDEVVKVVQALRVPSLVVLHTVLPTPTPVQRGIVEALTGAASAVITMTEAARSRLLAGYRVGSHKVVVIPHGAAPTPDGIASEPRRVLTWGLLGPGKGIEWGVAAMALLRDLDPLPHYLIAGQTHPKVEARDGHAYRDQLRRQARNLGVAHMVSFDANYRPTAELIRLIATAHVALLPYDSTEQETSGVLIEAVAAARPVVATRFPHAVELLADGAGITVRHRDPAAIAEALRRLLTDPESERLAKQAAARAGDALLWPAVASRYAQLALEVSAAGHGVLRRPVR
jgi:glycosyltransferase involved in cell wall biosynthesis